MSKTHHSILGRIKRNMRSRILQGLLVVVPIGITLLIMKTLFTFVAGFLLPAVQHMIKTLRADYTFFADVDPMWANVVVSTLSILLLVALVYCVGVVSAFVVGRRVIGVGESLVMRIPLVKSVYSASKQVVQSLSLPDRGAFKATVAIEFPAQGMKTIGFVTGGVTDANGEWLYKVFIPTTPNVTTGFYEIAKAEMLQLTNLTVEDAFKMVISAGMISPEILDLRPFTRDAYTELIESGRHSDSIQQQ